MAVPQDTPYGDLKVEVSFTTDALAAPSYTDVTEWVRSMPQCTRGRGSSELERFDTGELTVILDNRDGRFFPDWEGSPYYPNLTDNRRIRISFDDRQGNTHELFTGFTDAWQPRWELDESRTVLRASGFFKQLAQARLPDDVWELELGKESLVHWWRLSSRFGTQLTDRIGEVDGVANGEPTLDSQPVVALTDDGAVTFDGEDDEIDVAGFTIPAAPAVLGLWFRTSVDDSASSEATISRHLLGARDQTVGASANIRVQTKDGSVGQIAATLTDGDEIWTLFHDGGVIDDARHLVLLTFDTDGTVRMFLDGLQVASETEASAWEGVTFAQEGWLGRDFGSFSDTRHWSGQIDDAFVGDAVPSDARIDELWLAGSNPWDGDTSGERVDRILDAAGIRSADRTTDGGNSTLGPTRLGVTVLEACQRVDETELGRFYEARDGRLTFDERHRTLRPPDNDLRVTLQYPDEVPYADAEPDFDEANVYNVAVVAREQGSQIKVEDASSVAFRGEHTFRRTDLLLADDADVRLYADWVLLNRTSPRLRITEIELRPGSNGEIWRHALDRDIGDRIAITVQPRVVGELTFELEIEEVEHEHPGVGAGWRTTWRVSPAPDTDFLVLDDAVQGKLDENRLAY